MEARGEQPTKAHNNCSGKHAGMIAVGRHAGWGHERYHVHTHRIQRRCLQEVAHWTGIPVDGIPHGADGCGVPSFAVPLASMAAAYARLGAAVAGDDVPQVPAASVAAARRLVAAVRAHPFLLAGSTRLDTALLELTHGRIIAKVGAEGVYSAVIPDMRLGLALKVEDGATRAAVPALLALLDRIVPGVVPDLEHQRIPAVKNTLGHQVGALEPCIELDRSAS
jgi:L-asparaginase II